MSDIPGRVTPSGVFLAEDFRDNLIIDRFDPVFVRMRASKLRHMRSRNSEDVVSWNVFRTLRQIDPTFWVTDLMAHAFGHAPSTDVRQTTVELWQAAAPPPALLQGGDEGISEIDVLIENPHWVLFIEAKLKSDISTGTTVRPDRDQVLRNLDVGSYYAGVRDFYFALLTTDPGRSPKGAAALLTYADREALRSRLPHRHDGLANLRGIGTLTWVTLHSILTSVASTTSSPLEQGYATRCAAWLQTRGFGGGAGAV
jgi:hypothetical protein